jgi:hypothetical protein
MFSLFVILHGVLACLENLVGLNFVLNERDGGIDRLSLDSYFYIVQGVNSEINLAE